MVCLRIGRYTFVRLSLPSLFPTVHRGGVMLQDALCWGLGLFQQVPSASAGCFMVPLYVHGFYWIRGGAGEEAEWAPEKNFNASLGLCLSTSTYEVKRTLLLTDWKDFWMNFSCSCSNSPASQNITCWLQETAPLHDVSHTQEFSCSFTMKFHHWNSSEAAHNHRLTYVVLPSREDQWWNNLTPPLCLCMSYTLQMRSNKGVDILP